MRAISAIRPRLCSVHIHSLNHITASSGIPAQTIAKQPLTDAPSPSFLRDSAQIEARANASDRYKLAWDPTYLESVLVSSSKAHPRMVVELALNASLDQLIRVHSLVDSKELHEAVSLIPQLRRAHEFQASLQAILRWNFRNLRLLSLAGLPFHIARYDSLHILQLSLNAHKIWSPVGRVGRVDRVVVDGAISELIAQSQRIDSDFNDADDVAEMLGLVLRTYHEGVYADGETDVEELEKSGPPQRDHVAIGEEFRTFNLTDTIFITFAGCDSAVVDVDSASGLAGFIHDALRGGVKFAIGSVWPLSDEFSPLFFTRFYQELSQGTNSGSAFHKSLAETRSSASSTFQWGSLDFYGDPFVNITRS